MKVASVAAGALLLSALTPVGMTPAFAVDPSVQAQLTQYCDNVLKPAEQSDFTAVAVNIVAGATTGGSTTTILEPGSEHVNGQSPNIHGWANIITSGGMTNYTFDCHVHKDVGQGNHVEPNGHQIYGATHSLPSSSFSSTRAEVVICISPSNTGTKNPGAWRPMNGYTGECSRRVYDSLPGSGTPSNSLPS